MSASLKPPQSTRPPHQWLAAIHAWDVLAFNKLVSRPAADPLTQTARFISHSGNGYLYPLVPLVIIFAGLPQPLTFLTMTVLAFSVERSIYLFVKKMFKRRRPANILPNYDSVIIASDEFSFPSGHSSAAFLMVTLLVTAYGSMFAPLYLWSALVAASRVLVGVHFPTDILVGSLLGTLIATLCCHLLI